MGMRMNLGTTALLATLCVTATACNKPAAQKADDAASKAAPAMAAKFDPMQANPLGRKPGLWQIANTVDGASPTPMTICVDATLGEKMSQSAGQLSNDVKCAKRDIRGTATGAVVDQVCTMNETTMTSHIEIVSASDDSFQQTIDTQFSPAMMGRTESKVIMDGKWQGACPAGMKAGDMRLPGGVTVNMYSMLEAAKKHK